MNEARDVLEQPETKHNSGQKKTMELVEKRVAVLKEDGGQDAIKQLKT